MLQGRPWKPYQREIAAVAGEQLPNGAYAYPVVVLTMPRQSAKTTTAYDVALGRGRAYRDYRVRYATHKGTITSDRYADWFLELERNEPLLDALKLRRSRGTEAIGWRRTGSYFQAFPAREGALRSAALDCVIVDEAQEHDDILGNVLREMINATFTTRPRRQLWIVFSAGTDASTYAASYLERGRAGEPGVALFDYGCPDDVDPLDRDLWRSWHPGLAAGLTDDAALEMALADGEAAFVREYGNRWTRTASGRVIPVGAWLAAQSRDPMPDGTLALGVDVAADRSSACIAIAGPDRHVEIIESRPGVDWVADRALELQTAHGAVIVLDSIGPVATVLDELRRAIPTAQHDARLRVMQTGDVAVAAAGFLDAVLEGTLAVWPNDDLDAAVDAAAKRPLGDAGFAWSRKTSAGPIAPLVAACAALWGQSHAPAPRRRPVAVT